MGNIHGLVVDYILLQHYVVLMKLIVVQIGNLVGLNLAIIVTAEESSRFRSGGGMDGWLVGWTVG